ncbi:hypothetical protein EBU91_04775 [bacterium]|nr:hypothetical protein [bacterium]
MKQFIIALIVCIASPMSWAGSRGHRGAESNGQTGARPVAHVVELDSQELEGITNQQQALSAFQDWLKQRFPDPKKKILIKMQRY